MIINKTSSSCGAIITDINLEEGFSNQEMITLLDAIYEHKCLVIKDQDFSHKGYKRFGSEWGTLIKHMLEYLRAPSFPELMVIGNTEKKDKDENVKQ